MYDIHYSSIGIHTYIYRYWYLVAGKIDTPLLIQGQSIPSGSHYSSTPPSASLCLPSTYSEWSLCRLLLIVESAVSSTPLQYIVYSVVVASIGCRRSSERWGLSAEEAFCCFAAACCSGSAARGQLLSGWTSGRASLYRQQSWVLR